jgi:plastocyanin domain-containing protein
MTARTLLLTAAASIALLSAPARAQQAVDHGASTKKAQSAAAAAGIAEGTLKDGVRTIEMAVTEDGFVPAKIKASKGEKLRLVITRKTERTCATEIVIKDHGINQPLPLHKTVMVEVSPKKSGEIRYACGMDMISGVIFVP